MAVKVKEEAIEQIQSKMASYKEKVDELECELYVKTETNKEL